MKWEEIPNSLRYAMIAGDAERRKDAALDQVRECQYRVRHAGMSYYQDVNVIEERERIAGLVRVAHANHNQKVASLRRALDSYNSEKSQCNSN